MAQTHSSSIKVVVRSAAPVNLNRRFYSWHAPARRWTRGSFDRGVATRCKAGERAIRSRRQGARVTGPRQSPPTDESGRDGADNLAASGGAGGRRRWGIRRPSWRRSSMRRSSGRGASMGRPFASLDRAKEIQRNRFFITSIRPAAATDGWKPLDPFASVSLAVNNPLFGRRSGSAASPACST